MSKEIVSVAYLLVWAWIEHKVHSGLSKKPPQNRMVILIDEMEAHLHPKPAARRSSAPFSMLTGILGKELEAQVVVGHPFPALCLASLEEDFQDSIDKSSPSPASGR